MVIFEFFKEFFGVLAEGLIQIFKGVFGGLFQMFNFKAYSDVFRQYSSSGDFTTGQWALAILGVIFITGLLIAILWIAVYFIFRFVRKFSSKKSKQNQMAGEILLLRRQIKKELQEKQRVMNLLFGTAVSGGFVEGGDFGGSSQVAIGSGGKQDESNVSMHGDSRFFKLTEVDELYNGDNPPEYELDKEISLADLCDRIRNYAANNPERPWRKLYYDIRIIRLFIAALSTTRLVILQGISGTGKTSLPECLGHFFKNATTIASVQPSWRDRTEIFGYFNEFTKRFNETEMLRAMYDATYNDKVYLMVLDEMNIARVEYYFAEMLSILEMPSREQWIVDLVPSGWPNDPKHIYKGRFTLPQNMWYVGTANNDDSTFAISDKVYDRGLPININDKGRPFEAPLTEGLMLSASYMESKFKEAQEKYAVSEENKKKFEMMDDYVIEHFRLAFGNRITKQMTEFVPAYVGCGGTEIDGLDYVLCNKILRKFESLNLAYIRDEIDDYIQYLSDNFGEENMMESKGYLQRLKKLF